MELGIPVEPQPTQEPHTTVLTTGVVGYCGVFRTERQCSGRQLVQRRSSQLSTRVVSELRRFVVLASLAAIILLPMPAVGGGSIGPVWSADGHEYQGMPMSVPKFTGKSPQAGLEYSAQLEGEIAAEDAVAIMLESYGAVGRLDIGFLITGTPSAKTLSLPPPVKRFVDLDAARTAKDLFDVAAEMARYGRRK